MSATLSALDLFCGGAGGWSVGLHRAGLRTVAACENDIEARDRHGEREFKRLARRCIAAYGDAVIPQITEAIVRAILIVEREIAKLIESSDKS